MPDQRTYNARRALIAEYLKQNPKATDEQCRTRFGCSQPTVLKVRRELGMVPQAARRKPVQAVTCAVCPATFPFSSDKPNRKYCSHTCSNRDRWGKAMPPRVEPFTPQPMPFMRFEDDTCIPASDSRKPGWR